MTGCSFCGYEFPKGTGKLFIQKDGKMLYFCTSKCQKNMLVFNKKALRKRWTKVFADAKKSGAISDGQKEQPNKQGKKK
jgi:large subunit ribosomal protein L24e